MWRGFHFVSDGLEAALAQPRSAAGHTSVKTDGWVSTKRLCLRDNHVDVMHLVISPVVLGRGEAMFPGLGLPALGFRVVEHVATEAATQIVIAR